MAEIVKRNKPLSVNPLKTSQTVGGALAFLGVHNSIPLMHGSQGCTAFAKVFFVRHFREPIPLQTTAMDHVTSIMGADDNIIEGLKTICEKNSPAMIGLVTTGLAETQGSDIHRVVKDFRQSYPQFSNTVVVPVNTPDFSGSFESGFSLALTAMIDTLVEEDHSKTGHRKKQVNVLCSGNVTPGDIEFITESIESFGLRPLIIPDLSTSLDGHLTTTDFNPLTVGGVSVADIKTCNQSIATLVVGESLCIAANRLKEKTGVPDYRFGLLMGLEVIDKWLMTLSELSENPVPEKWRRHRSQLQDAMLDTHFMIGDSNAAIAGDPDIVLGFSHLLAGIGGKTVTAVVPANIHSKSTVLRSVPCDIVKVGDLEDAEIDADNNNAQIFLGSSHAVETAKRLGIPLLRVGFPQYDLVGGYARCWFGYKGTQQTLFDIANLLALNHHGVETYTSTLKQSSDKENFARH